MMMQAGIDRQAPPMSSPSTRDLKISVAGVNVYYGEKQALKDVSVDLRDREVTALIGPSGCGKTTFLNCLNRSIEAVEGARVEGTITLNGRNINGPDVDPVDIRRRFGIVAQKPNPFPWSIYNNVAYGPRLHGLASSRDELDDIVQRSLQRADLWDEVRGDLGMSGLSLSGGQQQRLCIARALAYQPEVILMDEPCSALDPIATAHIEELIAELRQQLMTIIVTHNMQQAARVSQRTAFFYMGTLVETGETASLFANPRQPLTQDFVTGRMW